MNRYYIIFSQGGNDICGTWQEGKTADDAMLDAEFKLITQLGGTIPYDSVRAIDEQEYIA